jgi:hypothetical protein
MYIHVYKYIYIYIRICLPHASKIWPQRSTVMPPWHFKKKQMPPWHFPLGPGGSAEKKSVVVLNTFLLLFYTYYFTYCILLTLLVPRRTPCHPLRKLDVRPHRGVQDCSLSNGGSHARSDVGIWSVWEVSRGH